MTRVVVYSDLDGTLLDHDSYDWAPAAACLTRLRALSIPVIPCTSKTRAEVRVLREAIGLTGPFIVENGAAVVLPEDTGLAPADAPIADGDAVVSFVAPRAHWLAVIESAYAQVGRVARGFSTLSTAEIAALTGLSEVDAARSAAREYGEPLQWVTDVDPEARAAFVQAIEAAGARVLQGGRFAHVSGAADKGRALRWLQARYKTCCGRVPISIAAGDSGNDVAMLEAADLALVVRSPAHPPVALQRTTGVLVSSALGPAGWSEGITALLEQLQE
jgi:mannosyl-3-phosphoglycerate phosphatase family protein